MTSITDKIDELLKSDTTFTTRAGMRFMTEVIKDAFTFIEQEKTRNESADQKQSSIESRLGNVEKGLYDFLELRKKEQEKNESERSKWRWAIIAPTITLVIVEISRWLLNKP